jgi:hypothetical protein
MSSCAGIVVDAFIETHTRLPPWDVCMNYDCICQRFPEDRAIAEALLNIFEAIDRQLPENVKVDFPELHRQMHSESHGLSLPLYQVVSVPKVLIEILYQFYNVLGDEGYEVRKQLQDNENTLFNLTPYQRRSKGVPLPTSLDMEPRALAWAYLKGTPFVELFNSEVPFVIDKVALSEHLFACAKQGHGKTVLLSHFVTQFLQDPAQPGLFILDPAGDWFNQLKPRIPPERLIVLDPETDPPALNFFDFKNTTPSEALQAFRYLMSALTGGLSDKQNNIAPFILNLLQKVEKPSLRTLRKIVDERPKKAKDSEYWYAIDQLDEDSKDFFCSQFYNSDMNVTKNSISIKIHGAMGSDAFKKMFTADHNSFDARAAMEGQKVVLVRGSENTLGEFGLPIFMQFIVSQIFMAALARFRIPEHKRKQCYLICDEASHIYNHHSTRLLVEARKLKLSFFSATQMLDQIPTEVKAAVNGNTSIKAAGWLQSSDANMMAREMRGTTGQAIQDLNKLEWIVQVQDAGKAVKVRVPYGALEELPKFGTHEAPAVATWPELKDLQNYVQELNQKLAAEEPEDPFARYQDGYYKQPHEDEPEYPSTDEDHIRPARE